MICQDLFIHLFLVSYSFYSYRIRHFSLTRTLQEALPSLPSGHPCHLSDSRSLIDHGQVMYSRHDSGELLDKITASGSVLRLSVGGSVANGNEFWVE
jgi:hypothetical protein